jgi:prefoldin subunit 5
MQKMHDEILAEADWAVEFLTEERDRLAARGDDVTPWQTLPELVQELRDYADNLRQRLTEAHAPTRG